MPDFPFPEMLWLPVRVHPLCCVSDGRPHPERSTVATVISLLAGRALEWATAVWKRGEDELGSYERFMALFRTFFDHPPVGREGGERLSTPAGYPDCCRVRPHLSDCWHVKMTSYPWTLRLDIQTDGQHSSGAPESTSPRSPPYSVCPEAEPEPMEVGATHLSAAVRLCPYCGKEGHQLQRCQVRPNPRSTRAEGWSRDLPSPRLGLSTPSSLSTKPFLESISLAGCPSSAAGNFIYPIFLPEHNLIPALLFFCCPSSENATIGIWHNYSRHRTTHPHRGTQAPGKPSLPHHHCTCPQSPPRPPVAPTP